MADKVAVAAVSANPLDIFIQGMRKGFNVAVNNLVPNVVMAFVLSHILTIMGVMDMVSSVAQPLMGLFGLPGAAITVLLTAWLSASAGTGVCVSLVTSGVLNGHDVTILMPAIFLMASQIQYMGRLLGTADCPKRYWPLLMATSIMNAVIAMIVMNFFI